MKTCLFLCTGNYYRSRFAEEYFNHLTTAAGNEWQAISRGLARDMNKTRNPGPISKHTLSALELRGAKAKNAHCFPKSVGVDDFKKADRVIAICKREHQPMIEQRFSEFSTAVEYWDIEDIAFTNPEEAIPAIEAKVNEMTGKN